MSRGENANKKESNPRKKQASGQRRMGLNKKSYILFMISLKTGSKIGNSLLYST